MTHYTDLSTRSVDFDDEVVDLELTTVPNPLGAGARKLYDLGFSVIPISSSHLSADEQKLSFGELANRAIGKKPHGVLLPRDDDGKPEWAPYKTARCTEEELVGWFGEAERYGQPLQHNIGVVLGAVSGFVVVDCDSQKAEGWARDNLPATPMVALTHKGRHLYYRHPGTPTRNKVRFQEGNQTIEIDVKGDGGYVVAPPSRHLMGTRYTWETETWDVEDVPVFDQGWFPQDSFVAADSDDAVDPSTVVAEFPTSTDERRTVLERCSKYISKMPAVQGQRDDTAFKVACVIRRGFNIPSPVADQMLAKWNDNHCSPPLGAGELAKKIASALRSGKGPFGEFIVSHKADISGPAKDTPAASKKSLAKLQRNYLTKLVEDGYVATPGGSLYRWDADAGYYAPLDIDTVHTDLARLMLAADMPASKSQILSLAGATAWLLADLTWKPEHQAQQQDSIAFANGTISRKKVMAGEQTEPEPADPSVFCTYRLNVAWNPDADRSPVFDRLLPMFGGDIGIQKLDEYGLFAKAVLLGDVSHQKAMFLYGPPGTGKSQLAHILAALVPPQHQSSVGIDQLGADNAEYYLARLKDSLLNIGGEISKPNHKAVRTLKQLTGGDPITARPIRREPIEFVSRANLLYYANDKFGRGGDTSGALDDRIRVLVLDQRVRDTDDAIPDFGKWFMAHHSDAFVAWAMARTGIYGRSNVYDEENAEGMEEDEYASWALENMHPGPNFLSAAVADWNKLQPYRTSPRKLAAELSRLGWEKGGRVWNGNTDKKETVYAPPDGFFPVDSADHATEVSFDLDVM